ENVGWGKIHLPEQELQTTSFWCSLPERAVAGWPKERVEIALAGLGNLLHGLAPLLLMCDPHDLGLAVEVRSPHTERPTIYLFDMTPGDRKSTRLNSSHRTISYAVFCLKKKNKNRLKW